MHKIIIKIFVLLLFATAGKTQSFSSTTTIPIMEQTVPILESIENDYYTIKRIEFDHIFLEGTRTTPIYLYKNKVYHLVVIGDNNRIKDIDFSIYHKKDKGDWEVLKSVNSDGLMAMMTIYPKYTGYYELEFRLDIDKNNEKGKFGFIIYY